MSIISVLISCHNRKKKTIKCLEYLYNQKYGKEFQIHVFLVDDGSTDGTSETVIERFSKIHIIKGDGNLFWNRGMNLAWKEAAKINPDFYLWLNDDTFLFENCLHSLLESSIKKNNQSIIVGTTISEISGLFTYGGRGEDEVLIEPSSDLEECYCFNGNIVLIPKSVFHKVGYLDNVFHHAIGDFDYGLRARKQNIKIIVASTLSGICESHERHTKWCQPEVPLNQRLSTLYTSTCDCNPKQIFIFNKRHFGILKAVISVISVHVRVFFPSFWKK